MAVARRKGLQPVATPLLREMDWGVYTGKVADEMDFTTLPESVETIDALYKRAGDFVSFLKKEFPGKTDSGDRAWRLQPRHHRAVGETHPGKDTEFADHEEYGMHAFHAAVIFRQPVFRQSVLYLGMDYAESTR